MREGHHLYLVDGSSYLFRAFHALPRLTSDSGLPVGAVSGYCQMLHKLVYQPHPENIPTHLAVIFDASKKTFRNEIYPPYKANRPPPPKDLIPQMAMVREATRALGISAVELKGFEADDLIATYARHATNSGAKVTIVSSDKDLMQLIVDGKVDMLDTMKGRRIRSVDVIKRFGVPPEFVVDVQALAGDKIDNVPGIPGVGLKGACALIQEFGSLENVLANVKMIRTPGQREAVYLNADKALISKRLVSLDNAVKLPTPLDSFTLEPNLDRLGQYLRDVGLRTLAAQIVPASDTEGGETKQARVNDLFAWHAAALAYYTRCGTLKDFPQPPNPEVPQCGWYQRRMVKDGPFVPVAFFREDNGMRCILFHKYEDPREQWTYCCARPISYGTYKYLVDLERWAKQFQPQHPAANPFKPCKAADYPMPF